MSAPPFAGENLVRALSGAPAGPRIPWLDAMRARALARLRATGLPTPREEGWKYTNVAPLGRREFRPAPDPAAPAPVREVVEAASAGLEAAERMVFVNGRYLAELSAPGEGRESLATCLGTAPGAIEPYLARYVNDAAGGFGALSTAFFSDGAFLRVEGAAHRLVHLVHVAAGPADTVALPRHVIVLERGSAATVVETFLSADGGAHCCNAATEIVVGEDAHLDHYRLQAESDATYHIGTVEVSVRAGAGYASHQIGIGGRLSRTDLNVRLDAEHARCALDGLALVNGRRHTDFHTRIDHLHPHGTSRELFKGILDGHGHSVFNGLVYVHPGARRTDSTQANHNLLLSRDAEVDTKPELQIFADDVQCSHGATVGQLDESMLFYLRSRGLDESQARATLTLAFADDLLRGLSLPALRRRTVGALCAMLPAGAALVPDELLGR